MLSMFILTCFFVSIVFHVLNLMLVTWTLLIILVAELYCQLLYPSPVYTNFPFLLLLDHLLEFLERNQYMGVVMGKQFLTPVSAMSVVTFLTINGISKNVFVILVLVCVFVSAV